MAVLIPDEKSLVLLIKKIFWLVQDAAGYHLGPVAPPRTDGASLGKLQIELTEKPHCELD